MHCILRFVVALTLASASVVPGITGDNLLGKPTHWEWAGAKPTVAIFAFSHAAGSDATAWRRQIEQDAEVKRQTRVVTIIMLEPVPRLIRAMVKSGIKSSTPAALYETTMLVYRDEDRWKTLLNVSDDRHAYVALVDSAGRLVKVFSAGFSDEDERRLKDLISRSAS